jgi:hypothetical protein
MYHHLPPQIKGSMEKEQVLLANNLFVASYFQQTIANLHFCMPELHFPLCCMFLMYFCMYFFESQVAAGVAACFGWMVWMVAGIGGHGFWCVNFCSRK